MNHKEIINHRQMAWVIGAIFAASGFVNQQSELVHISGQDAWSSYMFPILYAFGVCFIFYYLTKLFPGKNLFQICFELCGKWVGGIVNLLFVVHLWLNLVRGVTSWADFAKVTLLPQTPREIIILVFVLLLMYFGRIGFESACRTNDIFFPLFVSTTLLLPLLLTNEINLHLLEPVLVEPFSHLIESNLLSTGWYGDVFIAGAFLHTMASAQELKSSLRHGIIIGSLVLVLFIVMELSVLGWHTSSNLFYPNFTLIQQIHVTDFLDRVDLFLQGVWFFVICSKMIFIYLALLIAVQSYSKQTNYQLFNMPTGIFAIITSILAFHSTGAFFNFSNYGATIIALAYQPVVFLLLLLLAKMKKSKIGKQEDDTQADGNAGGQSQMSDAEKKTHRTAKKWGRATILALFAAMAFLAFGIFLGHVDAMYGKIACIGSGLCLLSLWLTTYKEMKWSVRHALK